MEAEFLHNPEGRGQHAHSPHLLETDSGDLLATWYAYPGPEDHKNAKLVLARKPANESWGKSKPILNSLNSSAGNPVLTQDSRTGDLVLYFPLLHNYWNDATVFMARSSDEGRTWSAPAQMWDREGLMIRHSPVVLLDGNSLLPVYDEVQHTSQILRCRGLICHPCHTFDGQVIQPVLVRDSADVIQAFFRPKGMPHIIWRARSIDEGNSWSQLIRTNLPCPLSGIAAFATEDALGIVYNHTHEHQRTPLSIATSQDGGVSWSEPWHIDEMGHEASYPSFLFGSDGRVHGVYSYNRRMIKYVAFPVEDFAHALHRDR